MAVSQLSALLGSETPRLFTPPLRPLTEATSRGPEAIRFARDVLHIELYPWQQWFLTHALELNPDGTFRFRVLLLLVARQNGKTLLLLILFLWRLYVDGARLVIGTAQNLDMAEETWAAAVDMAEGVPELAAEIAHIDKANGKKTLRLTRGERYKVATASRRGGRSLSGDFVGLDELREHQTWESWAAITKTTMARQYAQILGCSNAGDRKSIVLAHLRSRALEGVEPTLGLFEWSAPDGCATDDRDGWRQANPALGYGISETAVASAWGTDLEDVFRTEVLCQWVDDLLEPVVPLPVWESHAEPDRRIDGVPTYALDVSPNRSTSAIALAGDAGGRPMVEIPAESVDLVDHRPGTSWVVPRLVDLMDRHGGGTVYLSGTASEALRPELDRAGVAVEALSGPQLAAACGVFFDAAMAPAGRGLVHAGQPELAAALALARRAETDHGWQWGRRKSAGDITPLVAATVALWAFTTAPPGDPSVYFL